MGMFRSQTMRHGTLVLPADRARDFVELIGLRSHVQFVDMNAHSMRRQYKRYIQRIDEMDRILRFLLDEIQKLPSSRVITGHVDEFLNSDKGYSLDRVEESLEKLYQQFQKFKENNADLLTQKNAAIEERAVVRSALSSLSPNSVAANVASLSGGQAVQDVPADALMGFSNEAGVVKVSDQEKFARMIFRATRGNAFTHFESIPEDLTDIESHNKVAKSVFVVYFQAGGPRSAVREKITRICQAYGVNMYPWPKSHQDAVAEYRRLEEVIKDKTKALEAYEDFFGYETAALLEVHIAGGNSLIEDYRLFCLKEKSIYATLNMFDGADVTLRADCWFPAEEEERIREMLIHHSTPNQVSAFLLTDKVKPKQSPPTYIRTTEFTGTFQSFVDTYGVPRYKEANPALLTIITFPFLFGIMYGDIGHGACVLAFGLYLCYAWKSLRLNPDEMVQMIGGGRYMIVLMGIFAVYAGFLYNDFFSLGVDIFGTRYRQVSPATAHKLEFQPDSSKAFPYPFGFDPVWKGAENELVFFNSFKMKFAVLIGGIQMTTGVFMKCLNSIYFKDKLTFIFEFLPQITFMLALVGFMDFLIIYKWAVAPGIIASTGKSNKPLIITNIIEMCMMGEPELIAFEGQVVVMRVCLVLMLISVPLMLLPKPLILNAMHKRRVKSKSAAELGKVRDMEAGGHVAVVDDDDEEEFDFGEEMIHQMIETIEFVLGTISNTASYLRLWALSLAHQQLSLVFFNRTIKTVLDLELPVVVLGILLFVAFSVFAAITFGVMLCMDSLECFLHALRLQWVEFQNKFYKADGYAFNPFNFQKTLRGKVE